jgi:hypothetical protein
MNLVTLMHLYYITSPERQKKSDRGTFDWLTVRCTKPKIQTILFRTDDWPINPCGHTG